MATVYSIDLAGNQYLNPHYLQTRSRINYLVNRYLSVDILSDRLCDLARQFDNPHPHSWEGINWKTINPSQIIGVESAMFLQIVASAAEIEAPIHDYSQESWGYFQQIHPQMARFIGGICTEEKTVELGVWEKEERQHSPLFRKIYQQFTGEKLLPKPNSVKGYQSTSNPWQDLYNHMIARISSEWSAASIYLWLMSHSTGELQQAIAQVLQDEINHLAKFWGFSCWLWSDSYLHQLQGTTKNLIAMLRHHQDERTEGKDIVSQALGLNHLLLVVELTFTLTRIMIRLRRWNQQLSSSYLNYLFGQVPIIEIQKNAA